MKVDFYKLDSISKVVQPLLNQKLPAKAAYWLSKLFEKVASSLDKYEKDRLDMLKTFAVLDEAGEIRTGENGQAMFKDEETKNEFYKKCDEIRSEEITIIFNPITIENLGNAELTAYDIDVLIQNSIVQE